MAGVTVRILGCGSSGGVPRIGGDWGACDPANPKNKRSRCSVLVTRTASDGGTTRVLIDTAPDMREQLIAAGVGHLDAVVYTHPHADHVHGIDDLRQIVFNTRNRLQVWADGDTSDALLGRFGYVFVQPKGSPYPPILELNTIDGPLRIDGAGGVIELTPFKVAHGSIDALGFRIGRLAYLPDVSEIPEGALPHLAELDTFVLDGLRRAPHPTHFNLETALDWFARLRPRLGVVTNMHNDLDYDTLIGELPAGVVPAYDGLELEVIE